MFVGSANLGPMCMFLQDEDIPDLFPVADDIDPAVSDGNPVAGSPVKHGAGRGEDGDFTVEALSMDFLRFRSFTGYGFRN